MYSVVTIMYSKPSPLGFYWMVIVMSAILLLYLQMMEPCTLWLKDMTQNKEILHWRRGNGCEFKRKWSRTRHYEAAWRRYNWRRNNSRPYWTEWQQRNHSNRWMEAPAWQQEQLLWLVRCLPVIWERTNWNALENGRIGFKMQRTRWVSWVWNQTTVR